jgi:hypothetical protein
MRGTTQASSKVGSCSGSDYAAKQFLIDVSIKCFSRGEQVWIFFFWWDFYSSSDVQVSDTFSKLCC